MASLAMRSEEPSPRRQGELCCCSKEASEFFSLRRPELSDSTSSNSTGLVCQALPSESRHFASLHREVWKAFDSLKHALDARGIFGDVRLTACLSTNFYGRSISKTEPFGPAIPQRESSHTPVYTQAINSLRTQVELRGRAIRATKAAALTMSKLALKGKPKVTEARSVGA